MRLTAFEPDEARDLVINPARTIGLRLEPFCDFVFDELAGYLPVFIQIACSHIVEVIQDNLDEAPDLKAVRHGFEDEAEPHFRFLWESFSEAEQIAYCHVTSGRSVPEPFRHAQRSLEARGYLRLAEGRPQPFSKAFVRFVRATDGRAECVPLWRRIVGLGRRR
jgi:hypothetical protein